MVVKVDGVMSGIDGEGLVRDLEPGSGGHQRKTWYGSPPIPFFGKVRGSPD